ncbi:MAG: hypothetical protein DMD35_10895 [Gemmatimonadetes bacterium]|nr:MAG: hypothetical protein DMD35_10895 [Gemmatimonadota bacterium]
MPRFIRTVRHSVPLLLSAALTLSAAAQRVEVTGVRSTHAVPVPTAVAVEKVGNVTIDGRLDEEGWSKATPITQFTQVDPEEGKPGTQRTEVRFLYDNEALYVGARMFEKNGPKDIVTRLVRRDGEMESDYFEIVIDAYHDHLGRAFFDINPSGVKTDALSVGTSSPDGSWDPIWEAGTKIDSLGWTAELRIPYSQLRFSRQEVQTWGLQVRRYMQRSHEYTQWSHWRKTEVGGPSRFGHLEGIRIGSVPKHLELLPYAVTRSRHIRPDAPNDPFNDGSRQDMRFGGDVKALLTSNLTLDATINPDFGQVEVDPATVNLSAFETFFEEKRPFFVAGSGIFNFGNASCYFCSNFSSIESFYSRRIGRAPQGAGLAYDAGQYADVPENSTILGAAKITGRTGKGITVGLLNALTRREVASVIEDDGTRLKQEVEPLSNYFVGRATKDYRDGNLVIGGIGTSVVRRLGDSALRDRLTSHAESFGGDLVLTWDKKNYQLLASAMLSNVSGDSAAIERVQRSSARYFQRPDRAVGDEGWFRSGLFNSSYRPGATNLRGLATYIRMAKDGGSFNWEAQANVRSPGFEVNDISFLSRADYAQFIGNLAYGWTKPTHWYRDAAFIIGAQQSQNFDGDLTNRDVHVYLQSQTPQFWRWNLWGLHNLQAYDDRLLRGGPVGVNPGGDLISANVSTDSRRRVVFNVNPRFQRNSEGGFQSAINTSLRWKPASSVQLTFGPSYNLTRSLQQYVTSVEDPTATAFAGNRYVFSSLVQKTLSMDTRVAVTFTANSTLEMYLQPFIASGAYSDFKEFDAPRQLGKSVYGRDRGTITPTTGADGLVTGYTVDPDASGPAKPFTFDNPSFDTRSLLGNVVYRWEYRPGSTLYLVWTQSRSDQLSYTGTLDFARDRTALFTTHPDNIFLVKVNYWLGR